MIKHHDSLEFYGLHASAHFGMGPGGMDTALEALSLWSINDLGFVDSLPGSFSRPLSCSDVSRASAEAASTDASPALPISSPSSPAVRPSLTFTLGKSFLSAPDCGGWSLIHAGFASGKAAPGSQGCASCAPLHMGANADADLSCTLSSAGVS